MNFEEPLTRVTAPDDATFAFMRDIPWFVNCGQRSSLSSEDAVASVLSIDWENFQLDRQGDITAFLTQHQREAYSEWNTLTEGLKAFLESEVYGKVQQAVGAADLSDDILPSVQWDLLSFMQEEAYAPLGIPRFYVKTMESYRQGRLPCGWEGDYPAGTLKEY